MLASKHAENAAVYLGKASHVNVVGRLRNNNFTDAEGREVYGMSFTCEELDYLDGKAQSDARRARRDGEPAHADAPTTERSAISRGGRSGRGTGSDRGAAAN